MKINNAKIFFVVLLTTYFLLLTSYTFPQQENVPIDHQVYTFIKEMSVKNILGLFTMIAPACLAQK